MVTKTTESRDRNRGPSRTSASGVASAAPLEDEDAELDALDAEIDAALEDDELDDDLDAELDDDLEDDEDAELDDDDPMAPFADDDEAA